MKRRDFLKNTGMLVATAGVSGATQAMTPVQALEEGLFVNDQNAAAEKLIVSAPMLQNYAANSVGVAFAVSAMANGYVVVGEKADLSDGRKVKCGGFRVTDISDRVIQVRLTGLKPSTMYYYRIGADRISYKGGYNMKILDT